MMGEIQAAAFGFLRGRPHDIVVTARFSGREGAMRQVRVYLGETSRLSNTVYDVRDPQYAGSMAETLAAAAQALLAEVRARVIDKQDFTVWYYTAREQGLIEGGAAQVGYGDEYWRRYVEALAEHSRLVGEDADGATNTPGDDNEHD
jgi:hypothetical protein